MASGFQPNISIKEAIDHIDSNDYLLPAIQRKFVWSSSQIEMLFDSIMRGYPINSFMFWSITDNTTKKDYRFYKFLNSYREFFLVNNPDFDTVGFKDFYAVIDGQQRLTSLYLGLKGTYAYKKPRKWWVDNEDSLPTRRLYLDLSSDGISDVDDDSSLKYNFKFLTTTEYNNLVNSQKGYWFQVRDILSIDNIITLTKYIKDKNLGEKEQAVLSTLYDRVHVAKLINYYLEEKQDIDSVLDIFIRTNSGGVPLSFSNLLMSITVANWTTDNGSDARKSLADLVQKVFDIGKPGFMISEDFILKTCLVLFKDNIKFNVKNFDSKTVDLFSANWTKIKDSIINTFTLLESWGFNNESLRAKNAVIPLIYFIYKRDIVGDILKKTEHLETKKAMRKWLCIALLKGIFGGQSDTILTRIKKVIDEKESKTVFPMADIIEAFRGSDRNFTLEKDFIENLLLTQKDSPSCYPILALIYSHMGFENDKYHKDHLHPATAFTKKKLIEFFGLESNIPSEYYTNPDYWNGIVNLQLLNSGLNISKNDASLSKWLEKVGNNINLESQLIPKDVSYDFAHFEDFYIARKAILVKILKGITSNDE